MDSPIALAVMAKAQAVFGNDNVFLSFPTLPLPFNKKRLSFVAGDTLSKEALDGLVEFTNLVNMIPVDSPLDPVWLPSDDIHLWDVYNDVLNSSSLRLAHSSRSTEEETNYQAAFRFLHIVHDDGTWEDTSQVKTYNQYQDAWFALQQDYNNQKIAADLSSDSGVKQQWQDVDEPAMRAKMQALTTDWMVNGYKLQVEEARSKILLLGGKSPSLVWQQWKDQINPYIDTKTSTSGQVVYLTSFSPSGAIDTPAWQRFTLTGDEVDALIAQVPGGLKKRLAADAVPLDIDTLSFEYSSVSITRPWLQTDLFKARFWRFLDGVDLLSDGRIPASGRCPAYVSAIVFARNVEVRLRAQSAVNNVALKRLRSFDSLSLGSFTVSAAHTLDETLQQPVILNSRPFLPTNRVRPELALEKRIAQSANVMAGDATSLVAASQIDKTAVFLRRKDFSRLELVADRPWRHEILEPSDPPTAPSAATVDDSIYIMAFICKRLPWCPNPDASLQW